MVMAGRGRQNYMRVFAHAWARFGLQQFSDSRLFVPGSPGMSERLSQRETLQQQCMWFILMHLEELPPSYLALLPLSIRKEIIT